MKQHNAETTIAVARPKAPTRSAAGRLVTLGLLLGLVASALAGCVFVPVGGYGYEHHGYYGHPYYRHNYYYYQG